MEVMHQIVVFILLAVHGTYAVQTVHYTEIEPRFAEPVLNITIAEGSNVTIPCQVESLGEKNAVSWILLDKNQLLTYNNLTISHDPRFNITVLDNRIFSLGIQNVQFNDSGSYLCQLNTNPVKESVGFLKVVEVEPTLIKGPYDHITSGSWDLNMECEAKSLGENYTLSFKHFGRNGNLTFGNRTLTSDPRVSIRVTDNRKFQLKIRDIEAADSGRYMCELNTEPAQSKVGYVEVIVLEFKNPDQLVEALPGETVILKCDIESTWTVDAHWQRDGEETEIVSNAKYESIVLDFGYKVQMSLIIKNVKPEDFGSYLCVANNTDWRIRSGNVTLAVKRPWFAEALPNVTAVVGSDVTIPCTVESARDKYPVVLMNMDKQRLLTFQKHTIIRDPRISLSVKNNRIFSLRIQNVQVEDSGRLSCQIYTDPIQTSVGFLQVVEQSDSNAAIYTSREDSKEDPKEATKTTDGISPKIRVPKCLVGAAIGEYVTLRCNLNSKPNSLTYWKLDGEGLTAHPNRKRTISILEKGKNKVQMKLGIQILSPEDFGTYTCVAKNSLGEAEGHIILHDISEKRSSACPSGEGTKGSTAGSAPTIPTPSSPVAAFVLDNVTLVCDVDSKPKSIVTWIFGEDEIPGNNDKYDTSLINNGLNKVQMRLTIKNIKPEDFGSYKCVAKNSLGKAKGEIIMFEKFQYPFMEERRHELTDALTSDG